MVTPDQIKAPRLRQPTLQRIFSKAEEACGLNLR
jgi:hypothetical protein